MACYSNTEFFGGTALSGYASRRSGKTILEIVENGFRVIMNDIVKSNKSGTTYYYFAIG